MDRIEEPSRAWQRFTWIDTAILLLTIVLGCLTSFHMRANAQANFWQDPPPWPANAGWGEVTIVGIILGSVYAAPLILLSQWIFRNRRQRLDVGEYLWLSPLFLWTVIVTASSMITPSLMWFFALVAGIITCSCMGGIAFFLLLFNKNNTEKRAPHFCFWTNTFGAFSCLMVGILLIYTLIIDPLQI